MKHNRAGIRDGGDGEMGVRGCMSKTIKAYHRGGRQNLISIQES